MAVLEVVLADVMALENEEDELLVAVLPVDELLVAVLPVDELLVAVLPVDELLVAVLPVDELLVAVLPEDELLAVVIYEDDVDGPVGLLVPRGVVDLVVLVWAWLVGEEAPDEVARFQSRHTWPPLLV